jgi:hypothetical protein
MNSAYPATAAARPVSPAGTRRMAISRSAAQRFLSIGRTTQRASRIARADAFLWASDEKSMQYDHQGYVRR